MTSHVIGKSQCPKCAAQGHDQSKDNLIEYSDGGLHCFRCNFHRHGDSLSSLKTHTQEGTKEAKRIIVLPADVDINLPSKAWDYLRQYSLTNQQISGNRVLWSDERQRLIFPYFDDTGLIAWQGRYLGEDKKAAKWFSQGDLKNILYILHSGEKRDRIILVEDVISAIRVGRIVDCMPLFGSYVSTSCILRLAKLYSRIDLWLDKDKEKDSYSYSKRIRDLGLQSHTIVTDKDPKEYKDYDIECLI